MILKLEKKSENEIRIHLSALDMDALEITIDDFDYNTTRTRKVIWDLFDRARLETGFDAAASRIYIQLYPKSDGSCDLLVTKLEEEKNAESLFLIPDFDSLFALLPRLAGIRDQILCYRDKKSHSFYLLLPASAETSFASEYGERIEKKNVKQFLVQHCTSVPQEKIEGLFYGFQSKSGEAC